MRSLWLIKEPLNAPSRNRSRIKVDELHIRLNKKTICSKKIQFYSEKHKTNYIRTVYCEVQQVLALYSSRSRASGINISKSRLRKPSFINSDDIDSDTL
jgi:hypothetical protein